MTILKTTTQGHKNQWYIPQENDVTFGKSIQWNPGFGDRKQRRMKQRSIDKVAVVAVKSELEFNNDELEVIAEKIYGSGFQRKYPRRDRISSSHVQTRL